ncbi:MAG: helix-turn-helix transcriptional regulator [Balneolaceae bacterium]|nr:helix-turn-helix transcriptional regulator [Balneolaceae bacterium]
MKNRIRELRARHRMSQAELADKLGVSRQTINAIENDKYDPNLSMAFSLSHLFDETVEEIFDKQQFIRENFKNGSKEN